MMKKRKFTILPMMLADIYRALTKCREGGDFFEGCSILNVIFRAPISPSFCDRFQIRLDELYFEPPGKDERIRRQISKTCQSMETLSS